MAEEAYLVLCADAGEELEDIELLEALSTAVGETLEDAAMYIFVYVCYKGACEPDRAYQLSKLAFMRGIEACVDGEVPTNCDKLWAAVKRRIHSLCAELRSDDTKLQNFYNFVYLWLFPRRRGEPTADDAREQLEQVMDFWELFYSSGGEVGEAGDGFSGAAAAASSPMVGFKEFPNLSQFCDFVRQRGKIITRDEWEQTFVFAPVVDYTTYDPMKGWPTLMDNYVDYVTRQSSS